MNRLLMICPHFPPDTTAASHRGRLLAPHLEAFGWRPTVLTVDPRDYDGRLEPGLTELLPRGLDVERVRAWPLRWTRPLGFGDLGLRAAAGLYRKASALLATGRFQALWITILPAYAALLGPPLKRRFGTPFVLDYMDPWVSAWGVTVGGGPGGAVDWKSRASRWLAGVLEPRVLAAVDGLSAVSAGTYEAIQARHPGLRALPCAEIPLGGEAGDFEVLRRHPRAHRWFDSHDGSFHLVYVGTLLPLGRETLRAFFSAIAALCGQEPEFKQRLRLHFFGTSNQTVTEAPGPVMPIARELGVAAMISEWPARIDYLDAMAVLTQADAILALGSSERHYTASKLFPALLARRPLLALYHEESTVVGIARSLGGEPWIHLVTYGEQRRASARVDAIAAALRSMLERPPQGEAPYDAAALHAYSAEAMAGRLAGLLDAVRAQAVRREPAAALAP